MGPEETWVPFKCGFGGNGRRVGFRFQCRTTCGFKSHNPYQNYTLARFTGTIMKESDSMLIKKTWSKYNLKHRTTYYYVGYFLFGFIPIYISRTC